MPVVERFGRLVATRVVADPAALDRFVAPGGGYSMRLAPDDLLLVPAISTVDVADRHAIVEPEGGFSGAWLEESRIPAVCRRCADGSSRGAGRPSPRAWWPGSPPSCSSPGTGPWCWCPPSWCPTSWNGSSAGSRWRERVHRSPGGPHVAGPALLLRRGDRRGRRPWSVDRLPPRDPPQHHRCGGARARLHRIGEHGSEHHGHQGQLRDSRGGPVLPAQRRSLLEVRAGDRTVDHARPQRPPVARTRGTRHPQRAGPFDRQPGIRC